MKRVYEKFKIQILLGILLAALLIYLFPMLFMKNDDVAPRMPKLAVLHPTYVTGIGVFEAGTMFLAKIEGDERLLAITALHVFGPKGGMDRQYGSKELNKLIQNISLVDAYDGTKVDYSLEALQIAGAAVLKDRVQGDFSAFVADNSITAPYFRFSKTKAKPGDRVWLASPALSGAPEGQKTHAATVVAVKEDKNGATMEIRYDNPKLKFKGSSGAPVIDRKGEVVGINVGGVFQNGYLHGYSNCATTVAKLIGNALRESKNQ